MLGKGSELSLKMGRGWWRQWCELKKTDIGERRKRNGLQVVMWKKEGTS